MRDVDQVALIKRALAHLEHRTTDTGPSYTAPIELYRSHTQLEREREVLFSRYALPVGFASQVRNPGDYLVFDALDHSILVMRDDAGRLGAFANFCRHRGTKLLSEGEGHLKKVICPYHSWAYALDGKLVAAPHRDHFEVLDDCRLKAYPVVQRYGLVWVKPTLGATIEERELGALSRDLDSFGFDSHVRFSPVSFRSPINWKLMIEGSLETYHFKYAHAKTIAPMFFDDLGVFDWDSPHARMFLPKKDVTALRDRDQAAWRIRDVGNVIYFFFPSTVLLLQPDHATFMSAYPISERESLICGGTLIPEEPADERKRQHWQKNVDIFWQAINEDYAMAERIQRGLDSGTVDEVVFGRSEFLIQKFHEEIRRALA